MAKTVKALQTKIIVKYISQVSENSDLVDDTDGTMKAGQYWHKGTVQSIGDDITLDRTTPGTTEEMIADTTTVVFYSKDIWDKGVVDQLYEISKDDIILSYS